MLPKTGATKQPNAMNAARNGKGVVRSLLDAPTPRGSARTTQSGSRTSGSRTRSGPGRSSTCPGCRSASVWKNPRPRRSSIRHRHHQDRQRDPAEQRAEREQRRKDAGVPVPRGRQLEVPAEHGLRGDERGEDAEDQDPLRPTQHPPLVFCPDPLTCSTANDRGGKARTVWSAADARPVTPARATRDPPIKSLLLEPPARGHAGWRSPAGTSDTAAASPAT